MSAVRMLPRCMSPVGDGAKRTRTVSDFIIKALGFMYHVSFDYILSVALIAYKSRGATFSLKLYHFSCVTDKNFDS